jgi:small subunit ribosomal protein S1
VRGKIARFVGFGVFVELDDGLEGLCHISELADDRVEKPEDVVQLGQEMDFRILRIDVDGRESAFRRALRNTTNPLPIQKLILRKSAAAWHRSANSQTSSAAADQTRIANAN